MASNIARLVFAHRKFTLEQAWRMTKEEVLGELKSASTVYRELGGTAQTEKSLERIYQSLAGKVATEKILNAPNERQEIQFRGVDLPLHDGTQELAILMSLSCKGDKKEHEEFDSFYPYVGALYHRWTKLLWPKETKEAPFMASVATFPARDASDDFPLIIGASSQAAAKRTVLELAQADLRRFGFKQPLQGINETELHKNFGNCAETTHWKITRASKAAVKCNHALAIRKGAAKELTPENVAHNLQQACQCCKDLAKQAGYSAAEIDLHFGNRSISVLKQKLSSISRPTTPATSHAASTVASATGDLASQLSSHLATSAARGLGTESGSPPRTGAGTAQKRGGNSSGKA